MAAICVVGVGGGGIAGLRSMVGRGLTGARLVAIDSDVETLSRVSRAITVRVPEERWARRLRPPSERRRRAHFPAGSFEQSLRRALFGADLVVLVAGLGGGVGSELAPVIAGVAREMGALVVTIVTYPFAFEGPKRAAAADCSVDQLKELVNTLIVIPNDRLLQLAGGALPFHESYRLAEELWFESVQSVSDLINVPGLINVDFADLRTIMSQAGPSIIARGRASGPGRAAKAADQATYSEILDVTIDGARGVLFNVTGGAQMSLPEVHEAAAIIHRRSDPDANIIFGANIDPALGDEIRLTVIATGCGMAIASKAESPAYSSSALEGARRLY